MTPLSSYTICIAILLNIVGASVIVREAAKPVLNKYDLSSSNSTLTETEYPVIGCEDPQAVHDVLNLLQEYILELGPEITKGVNSPYGYRALFKQHENRVPILNVVTSMLAAEGIKGKEPNPEIAVRPFMVCAQEDSQKTFPYLKDDPWQLCQASPKKYAMYAEDSTLVFLCPSFWSIEKSTTKPRCMSVQNNEFQTDGSQTIAYQVYVLARELARIYLGDQALTSQSVPIEKFSPFNLVNLNAQDSIRNPTNYQLFIASEFLFQLSLSFTCQKARLLIFGESGQSRVYRTARPVQISIYDSCKYHE